MIILWLVHLTAFPERLPFQPDIFLIKYPLSHWCISPFYVYKVFFQMLSIHIESSSRISFVLSQYLTHGVMFHRKPLCSKDHIFKFSFSPPPAEIMFFMQKVSNSSGEKESVVYFFSPSKAGPLFLTA